MKIKNVSTQGDLDVPILNRTIAAGEIFDVPADIGAALLEQPDVWASVTDAKEATK